MPVNPTYKDLEQKITVLEAQLADVLEKESTALEAKRNYKRFLNFLPDPVLVKDEKGRVSYINPAFTRTFGWKPDEFNGGDGQIFVPDNLKKELETRIRALPLNRNVLQINTQRLTRDGKTLDIALRVGLDRDEQGNPEGIIMVLQDITMDVWNRRNRSALNRVSQALPEYPDLKARLFFINTEIKRILETENASAILLDEAKQEFYFLSASHDDLTIRERINSARFPVDRLLSEEVLRTGKPIIANNQQDQYATRDKTLGYKVRNVILVPLRIKERIIGILAADNKRNGDFDQADLETLTTIAAAVALSIENARVSDELKKAYEELKSLNHAKDKMISHLSHELKTPVAILLSSFKILSRRLEALPDDTWKPTVERITRNLNRIIGIEGEVYDIVEKKEFSHHKVFSLIFEQCQDEIESLIAEKTGDTKLLSEIRQKIDNTFMPQASVFEHIFLDQFVTERIKVVEPLMAHRDIFIETRLEPVPRIRIPKDPLRKTVDGLIRNAVENTPDQGRIEISVRAKDRSVEFQVKDHGIGLTPEAQKRIFEGFFTTQDTMKYSSKKPYAFNAGGKGADLLRMKIFSEKFNFQIRLTSERCRRIPRGMDACPGSVEACNKIPGPACNGMTTVTCLFPAITESD